MAPFLQGLTSAALVATWWRSTAAQQAGTLETEGHPTITLKECTKSGGCIARQAKLTLDANWRWVHSSSGFQNCYKGDKWDASVCPDPDTCAQNCALEGISKDNYEKTYGVTSIPGGVKLRFATKHTYGTNVGSRLYVLDDDDKYFMFKLKNREFALDIDVSHVECGMNGAMYFVEMDESGGKGRGNNQAGAKYGTGYCDAQCPHDVKFVDGKANVDDWKPDGGDSGFGKYGSCCAEMDIWEANSVATAYTPHPCRLDSQLRCEGMDCGDNDKGDRYKGVCDKDGCDLNPFRMGDRKFYGRGPSFAVDTNKPMTVVTQFVTDDGTDDGTLSEIRRFYVQDGKTIYSPPTKYYQPDKTANITDGFCKDQKRIFGDIDDFTAKGGNAQMGRSLDRGHVMALSLWDDAAVNMLWLDSAYPLNEPADKPGVRRGSCPGGQTSKPSYLRKQFPDAYVSFANVAIGEIGSTQRSSGPTPSPTPFRPTPSPIPVPLPKPNPTPRPAPVGCAQFCGLQDLRPQGLWCNFLDKFPALCSWSYVSEGGGDLVRRCRMTGSKCRMDIENELRCPSLDTGCSPSATLLQKGRR